MSFSLDFVSILEKVTQISQPIAVITASFKRLNPSGAFLAHDLIDISLHREFLRFCSLENLVLRVFGTFTLGLEIISSTDLGCNSPSVVYVS